MSSRVSDRGQITIDRPAREELGIRPGMVAHQRVVDGRLEVIFLPESHHESLYGVFQDEGRSQARALLPEELEEAVMAAVAQDHEQAAAPHA